MNLGQTMITVGMFVLLMMSVISANRMIIESAENELRTEALASSSIVGGRLLVEIMAKPFDQRTVIDTLATTWRQDTTGTKVTSETGLSVYNSWRWAVRTRIALPDTSYIGNFASVTGLKDVDDYDNYTRILNYMNVRNYVLSVRVWYVNYTTPDDTTAASTRSYFKKVQVTVTQSQYNVRVVFSALASY